MSEQYEKKRDFMQWYMLNWIGSTPAGMSKTRTDALYQVSIAEEVYAKIEQLAKRDHDE